MEIVSSENKPKKNKKVSYGKWGVIFLIPFFVVYTLFTLVPQLMTIGFSFFEYFKISVTKYSGPKFVGFDNYINLFTPNYAGDIAILKYFCNTMIIWLIGALPQFVIALLLALIFTSTRLKIRFQGFFKSVFYMPNLIMASAFALLFFQLFGESGPINKMIIQNGGEMIRFLSIKISTRSLIAFMNFLMWFGNTTILLMAGIQGIDESLFESARMDGASSFKVFKDITLPLLKPILIYVTITSLIGGIQMFDVPQILTNGKGTPDNTSTTIVMLLNNYLGTRKNYGMAGAVSVILFLITGALSLIVYKTMAKGEED